MKKIKDIITKPSEALNAMVIGLMRQNMRSDFTISMETYGGNNGITCFGCAATSAVQELTKQTVTIQDFKGEIEFFSDNWDAIFKGYDAPDIHSFELAINSARVGFIYELFKYFNLAYTQERDEEFFKYYETLGIDMTSYNWCCHLENVIKFIHKLRQAGL